MRAFLPTLPRLQCIQNDLIKPLQQSVVDVSFLPSAQSSASLKLDACVRSQVSHAAARTVGVRQHVLLTCGLCVALEGLSSSFDDVAHGPGVSVQLVPV